jgi:hypothetical protein
MDADSTAPQQGPDQHRAGTDDVRTRRQLDSSECARELLAIVAYIISADGPLQDLPGPGRETSRWHQRLLQKASERLTVIDTSMRARVAFLVAGKDRGYHAPESELELAGTTLDTCRAATSVVDALLAGRLPTRREFEAMSAAALAIEPALDAVHELETPPRDH